MSWVDHAYAKVLRQKSRLDSPRRWKKGHVRGDVCVDYGYKHISEKGQVLSGGLVKVQDLKSRFPANRISPNLLYLVSSALPYDAEIQAKAAKKAGGIVVLNQNGVGYPGWHGPGWEKFNLPMKRIYALADFVVYQSEFCKQGAEKYLGPTQAPYSILHNPVDSQAFSPANSIPAGGPILLLAGTHQFKYRVEAAVETFALVLKNLPEARLRIAGQHTWTSQPEALRFLQSCAEQKGIADKIELIPPYSQTDAPALMRGAHILLHTKYNDPCPRLVVEAMACGLPVVYSATGGMPELIGERGGLGVPGPDDYEKDHPPRADSLANGVEKIWADYPAFRKGARQQVLDHLDLEPWLKKHEELFGQLLGGEGG